MSGARRASPATAAGTPHHPSPLMSVAWTLQGRTEHSRRCAHACGTSGLSLVRCAACKRMVLDWISQLLAENAPVRMQANEVSTSASGFVTLPPRPSLPVWFDVHWAVRKWIGRAAAPACRMRARRVSHKVIVRVGASHTHSPPCLHALITEGDNALGSQRGPDRGDTVQLYVVDEASVVEHTSRPPWPS